MDVLNRHNIFFRLTSILLVVLLVTPIVLSITFNEELCNYSFYENSQNEEQNNESDSEDKEEKRELKEFIDDLNSTQLGIASCTDKIYFFNSSILYDIRIEILTPPPEHRLA